MIKQFLSVVCFGLIAALVAPVQADITFGIDSSAVVSAGDSGTLVFYVTADSSAEQMTNVAGYAIGFTPSAFGGASLGDLTLGGGVSSIGGWTTTTTGVGGSLAYTAAGSPVMIGSRLDLFSVGYNVTGGSVGGFNLDITTVAMNDPDLFDDTGAGVGAQFGGVEAQLTYVPEPTSLGFLAGAAGLVALRRRRRKTA